MQEAEDEYIYRLARKITRENYVEVQQKKAAVLSCGKNSGCWKSDGREIPWELPEAPVNVIHRRLATGSVVDQMNAHPFAELHTALTHNGETTNYRTMLNRVSQFNLTPLAQTDTAVASLKLHLLSQYLHYPFDALVESFSPTTGWKLTQLPPEIKEPFRACPGGRAGKCSGWSVPIPLRPDRPLSQGDRAVGHYRSIPASAQRGHAL